MMSSIEKTTVKCNACKEMLAILKEVKLMMDSDTYSYDFDSIYDKVSMILAKNS